MLYNIIVTPIYLLFESPKSNKILNIIFIFIIMNITSILINNINYYYYIFIKKIFIVINI